MSRVGFAIYLIGDGSDKAALEAALGALPDGAAAFQLRAPGLATRALLERTAALLAITRAHRAPLLVNDRLDVALAAGADGVHLPARGLPAKIARRVAPELLVGASTHSLPEARMAAAGGADLVTFGPVWPTASHPGAPGLGAAALAEVTRALSPSLTVFALGGVDAQRAPAVIAAGARPACLTAVLGAADPAAAARAIAAALSETCRDHRNG